MLHLLVVLFDGGRFALGGEDLHGEAVEVFAVGVDSEYLGGVFESVGPVFFGDRELGEAVKDARELFAVIEPLLLGPVVVTAVHKVAAIESVGGFEIGAKRGVVLITFGLFGLGDEVGEFLAVDKVRVLGIELIGPVAKDYEILLERLAAV